MPYLFLQVMTEYLHSTIREFTQLANQLGVNTSALDIYTFLPCKTVTSLRIILELASVLHTSIYVAAGCNGNMDMFYMKLVDAVYDVAKFMKVSPTRS